MKNGITIGKIRSILYKSGKVLGDINAVKRGTIGHRLANRISGKITSRFISTITKQTRK